MKYECKCKPTQKLPHVVKSPATKTWSLVLHYGYTIYQKGIVLFAVTENLSAATSCDDKKIPIRRWKIGGIIRGIRFGKFID